MHARENRIKETGICQIKAYNGDICFMSSYLNTVDIRPGLYIV